MPICRVFLIHLPGDGHLDRFHFLTIVNVARISMEVLISLSYTDLTSLVNVRLLLLGSPFLKKNISRYIFTGFYSCCIIYSPTGSVQKPLPSLPLTCCLLHCCSSLVTSYCDFDSRFSDDFSITFSCWKV